MKEPKPVLSATEAIGSAEEIGRRKVVEDMVKAYKQTPNELKRPYLAYMFPGFSVLVCNN